MKKIQLNKIKLGLSLLSIIGATAIVAPILLSCGNGSPSTDNNGGGIKPPTPLPSPDVNEAIFGKEEPTVSRLKEFFTKPAELIKADTEVLNLVNNATNIQVDRESLKNEYFIKNPTSFETRLCLNFFNNEILREHKNYEINNKGQIINKEHNYVVYDYGSFEIKKLTKEDQEFVKQKTNWKEQPTNMTDREYYFKAFISSMKLLTEDLRATTYVDWVSSQMGKLKIITPEASTQTAILLQNNNNQSEKIYITNKGELGIFIGNIEIYESYHNDLLGFYENVLGINDFDKQQLEWTAEQREKYDIIEKRLYESMSVGANYKFSKSKPLNITKKENIELITKITIIKPETIIEDIKNKTIEEKLKLFNIKYIKTEGSLSGIYDKSIKDINVSKIGDVFQIEINFIDFISDKIFVLDIKEFIPLPDGLKLYSCLMSPWYTPKTIY